MSSSLSISIILLSIFLPFLAQTAARPAPPYPQPVLAPTVQHDTWHNFNSLVDADKGTDITGLSNLKKYFHRFGYLKLPHATSAVDKFTDTFDEKLETAIRHYQKNLGLVVTGKLDSSTVEKIMSPRCGVSDTLPAAKKLHVVKRFTTFDGRPRWSKSSPIILTYALSREHMIGYIDFPEIQKVFRRSFSRWSSVIPVDFTEISSDRFADADVKIEFVSGDHGDGEAFDGVLGLLGHAFAPEDGRLHIDAAETWTLDVNKTKVDNAFDLESVVTHEIGHVLGLNHSSVEEAIMYPNLARRTKKVELNVDDIQGAQSFYGSNPNYKYSSLLDSGMSYSSSRSINPEKVLWFWLASSIVTLLFILS